MSADSDAIWAAIRLALAAPLRVSGEQGSVEGHPIDQLVKADQYARAVDAARNANRGIRFTKLIPPGTA